VIYLAIFAIIAMAGITALWVNQSRQRRHLESVDGFRSSLEKVSSHDIDVPAPREERTDVARAVRIRRRPEPLDPDRREAAKRRLERRRAARV
jgi:hypothetical protein